MSCRVTMGGCVALALLLVGCTFSDRFVAGRRDYTLYRETRVAGTLEQRLHASGRYLHEEPHGKFRGLVWGWFRAAEPRFFAQAWDRPSLLKAYLRALPDGPHARAAADRLVEFDLMNEFRAKHEAQSENHLRSIELDLAAAAEARREFVAEFARLAGLIAAIKSFGEPTSALASELIYEFRLTKPPGHCGEAHCTKEFELNYAVPRHTGLELREADFQLEFELSQGGVAGASLSGVGLFSRVAEALDLVAIGASDLQERMEGIARTMQVVENSIEQELPSKECARDVIAPVVLLRECHGVRFRMTAGAEPGQTDRIELSPSE